MESPTAKSPEASAEACLAVCGIPLDATSRELHILFSGCPGYAFATLVLDQEKPYALVHFEEPEQALSAAKSRKNTSWDVGKKVDFEVRRSEHMEGVLRQRGFGPKHVPKRSAREESCPRQRPKGPTCSVEADVAKARVDAALKKNKLADLESSIKEASAAGVPSHELSEARQRLEAHQRRLAVRNAVFAQQRARNRLADAWDALSAEPQKRLVSLDLAIKEGGEACELCAKAAQRMEGARIREAIELVCKKWIRLVEKSLASAVRDRDVAALRAALAEGEAVQHSMTLVKAEGDEAQAEVSFFDAAAFGELLQQGQSVLVEEERRGAVVAKLTAAMDGSSKARELRAQLREAKAEGATGEVMARAQSRLAQLEGENAAKWMLFGVSLKSRDGTLGACVSGPEDLKFAIKAAKHFGMGKAQLRSALETYDQLEKLQTVFFALSDGLKETDPNQIKEVLRQVSEMELKGPPFFEIYIARLRERLRKLS